MVSSAHGFTLNLSKLKEIKSKVAKKTYRRSYTACKLAARDLSLLYANRHVKKIGRKCFRQHQFHASTPGITTTMIMPWTTTTTIMPWTTSTTITPGLARPTAIPNSVAALRYLTVPKIKEKRQLILNLTIQYNNLPPAFPQQKRNKES